MHQEANNQGGPSGIDYRPILEKRRQRNLNRGVFREMIKTELETKPLGWLRRRTLVKFATRLGIDEFEARLILRAVEYECGKAAKDGQTDIESEIQKEFVAQSKAGGESWLTHLVALAVVALIATGFSWLRSLN
ncbi:MAG: hypothetical protein IPK83_14485 [Planctomycetes bacterium]|nr:hypothetical protein [Planctomycetota bacterium]